MEIIKYLNYDCIRSHGIVYIRFVMIRIINSGNYNNDSYDRDRPWDPTGIVSDIYLLVYILYIYLKVYTSTNYDVLKPGQSQNAYQI